MATATPWRSGSIDPASLVVDSCHSSPMSWSASLADDLSPTDVRWMSSALRDETISRRSRRSSIGACGGEDGKGVPDLGILNAVRNVASPLRAHRRMSFSMRCALDAFNADSPPRPMASPGPRLSMICLGSAAEVNTTKAASSNDGNESERSVDSRCYSSNDESDFCERAVACSGLFLSRNKEEHATAACQTSCRAERQIKQVDDEFWADLHAADLRLIERGEKQANKDRHLQDWEAKLADCAGDLEIIKLDQALKKSMMHERELRIRDKELEVARRHQDLQLRGQNHNVEDKATSPCGSCMDVACVQSGELPRQQLALAAMVSAAILAVLCLCYRAELGDASNLACQCQHCNKSTSVTTWQPSEITPRWLNVDSLWLAESDILVESFIGDTCPVADTAGTVAFHVLGSVSNKSGDLGAPADLEDQSVVTMRLIQAEQVPLFMRSMRWPTGVFVGVAFYFKLWL